MKTRFMAVFTIFCISALFADDAKREVNLSGIWRFEIGNQSAYMKPDFDEPLILTHGDTVEDACRQLHRDFKDKFRYANVSGPSAKHDVQKVGLDHLLHDGDVLTIVIRK